MNTWAIIGICAVTAFLGYQLIQKGSATADTVVKAKAEGATANAIADEVNKIGVAVGNFAVAWKRASATSSAGNATGSRGDSVGGTTATGDYTAYDGEGEIA